MIAFSSEDLGLLNGGCSHHTHQESVESVDPLDITQLISLELDQDHVVGHLEHQLLRHMSVLDHVPRLHTQSLLT